MPTDVIFIRNDLEAVYFFFSQGLNLQFQFQFHDFSLQMGGNSVKNVLTTYLALYCGTCCRKSLMKLAITFC
jgi:hypothetical protein